MLLRLKVKLLANALSGGSEHQTKNVDAYNEFLIGRQALQCRDHRAGNLVLNLEDVGQFAIVSLGPQMHAVRGADQLRGDPARTMRTISRTDQFGSSKKGNTCVATWITSQPTTA